MARTPIPLKKPPDSNGLKSAARFGVWRLQRVPNTEHTINSQADQPAPPPHKKQSFAITFA